MGKVIESGLPCPGEHCGSSDTFSIYQKDNGKEDGYCYSCATYFSDPYKGRLKDSESSPIPVNSLSAKRVFSKTTNNQFSSQYVTSKVSSIEEGLLHPIREIKDRGISHATCEKYNVRVGVDTRDGITPIYHLYPYYRSGELTGFKQRTVATKSFLSIGDCKSLDLFGADTIKPNGKKLFITEGELDCLSVYQVLKEGSSIDWEPAVVSIPSGAGSIEAAISNNLDLINGYDQIILCLDNDGPGKEATKKACKILAGKVYTARLSEKDPNEMILKGKSQDLKWAVLTNARKYQPDGVVNGKDCWDRYRNSNSAECFPYPKTMHGLNEKTYGARPGSIVTITSGSGCGKTQLMRELKYHYLKTTDFKIADIALEEDIGDSVGGMLSLHLNKRITLPDVKVTEEEESKAFEEIYSDGRITLYDYFGGMDDDTLFSKLKYFIHTGHKFIFLDHLSIIVSEYASEGGERERIDTIMTKLAKLVKETGAIIFLVVHLKKSDHRPFEEGTIPSLDDLRGSGSIKQLSWDVIGLSRNQQHKDNFCANTSELTVLKCRFTGRTGSAGFLYFDDSSGRMIQTDLPVNYYQKKGIGYK